MAKKKKGILGRIAEAAGDAVQAVAEGTGLVAVPEPADAKPQSKATRKAEHKAVVERAEQAEKDARAARRRKAR